MCFSKPPKDNSAEIARQEEEERQRRIDAGTERVNDIFSQFDDSFYKGLREDYLNYYNPQLEDQFGNAREKTVAGLYRSGNIKGSAGGEKMADLFKAYNANRQSIADQALAREQAARSDVASNRAELLAQLEAGAGVDTTASAASAQAAALTQPAPYSPLGDMFAQFTGDLANNTQAQSMGYPGIRMPWQSNSNSNSVKVVGG